MSTSAVAYGLLGLAIVGEVAGTAFLARSEQFTRLLPTAAMALCYAASFYCLSHALKGVPLGVAYAIWGGLGVVLTAIIGFVVFRQALDAPAILGIGLIVSGVMVMNLLSQTATH